MIWVKKLSVMTLEELWDLFPIFLVPYDSRWNEYYNEMEDSIKRLVSDYPVNRVISIPQLGQQKGKREKIVSVPKMISV